MKIPPVGENIRRARLERGFTQSKIARSAKLAQPYLSQIETGKTEPSLSVLCAIAKALGVDPGELLQTRRRR